MAVMHKEDMQQQDGATPKIHEEFAKRQTEWPEWYTEFKNGERANVDVGSAGTVTIGLMLWSVSRRAVTEEATELEIMDDLLVGVVEQWPEAWGPIPRKIDSPEDRRAAYDGIPAKWVDRINQGSRILSGN